MSALLYSSCYSAPYGKLRIVTDGQGRLWQLTFPSGRRAIDLRPAAGLGREVVEDPERTRHVRHQLEEFFAGERQQFAVELKLVGSDFQCQVWRRLGRIPCGETRSYGQLAAAMGRPRAARAVGRANGLNPIAVIVPCHRLVGADGSLIRFAGGLAFKAGLLDLERRSADRRLACSNERWRSSDGVDSDD